MQFSSAAAVISACVAALAPSAALAQGPGVFFTGCWAVEGSPVDRCCEEYKALPDGNYTGQHCKGAYTSEDSSVLYCPFGSTTKPYAVWPACCQSAAPSNNTALDGMGYECTLQGASKDASWWS